MDFSARCRGLAARAATRTGLRMSRDKERRNRPALALHVPEPAARPGDAVDFSHIAIPAAGPAPRPDASDQPGDIRTLAYTPLSVPAMEGCATGPLAPTPNPHTLPTNTRANQTATLSPS